MTLEQIKKCKTVIIAVKWSTSVPKKWGSSVPKGTECNIIDICSQSKIASVLPVASSIKSLPIPVLFSDLKPGQLKTSTTENRATNIKKGDRGTVKYDTNYLSQGEQCIVIANLEKMGDSVDTLKIKSLTSSAADRIYSNHFIPADSKTKGNSPSQPTKKPVYTHIVINTSSKYTSLQTSLKDAKKRAAEIHESDYPHIIIYELKPILTINQTTTFKKVK